MSLVIIFILVWQYWTKCVTNFALTYPQDTYPIIIPPLIQPLVNVVHSAAENRLQHCIFWVAGDVGGGGGRYDNIHFFS